MCMYTYISAEASMASGRVDADRQSSEPFFPLNPGRVSLPLPFPPPRLGRLEVSPESLTPFENAKKTFVFTTLSHMGAPRFPQGSPKDPQGPTKIFPGHPQDAQGHLQ